MHALVAGSGLSSSSALVCASSLAILGIHKVPAERSEVAEFTCTSERYVGVQSGGMDQAISMLARPGLAQLIEFNPVRPWMAGCDGSRRCGSVIAALPVPRIKCRAYLIRGPCVR